MTHNPPIRLRHDKVVKRLVADVQQGLRADVPATCVVLFTCTAPIRVPARTAEAITAMARACLARSKASPSGRARSRKEVHGNSVCVRVMRSSAAIRPAVQGFVHNPDCSAAAVFQAVLAALPPRSPAAAKQPQRR